MKSTLLFAVAITAAAQPSIDSIVNELSKARHFREAVISPDGSKVAWVETGSSGEGGSIFLRSVSGESSPARLTGGASARVENNIAWSPDSARIAFLSDAGSKGQQQLLIASASAPGRAKKITNWKGASARPRWSPDGKWIAVLFANGARFGGAVEAVEPEVGEIDSQVYDQRLALVDPGTGQVRELTPAGLSVHEFDWSPDSHAIAYTAAPSPADPNWWVARLYTIEIDSRKIAEIHKPAQQISVPRWSPDGRRIAFVGGIMSDEGVTGGDLFVVPAVGGEARNLTANRRTSPAWVTWLPSSQRLLFTEYVKGSIAVSTLDLASGAIETQWRGDETIIASGDGFRMPDISLAADGRTAALIRNSFTRPPEVWAGPVGDWKQITKVNAALKPLWGEARSVEWTSDGMSVQGWLILPATYDASKHYPMVVSIHGGPASQNGSHWPGAFFDLAALSAQGYFVFLPNPRGSYGQGEAFTAANRKDFGHGDLRDILAGVDEVLKSYPVDNQRLGVGGWSYGGFMTMWTVTQTSRFKAAVAGAGVANWQSYYGQNGIDQWMIPYFGATVYDDPAVYARSSPINFIGNAHTPTLVLVGERDGECPAPQSFEFWRALKRHGVDTQLVVYPGEGHIFREPEHARDVMRRTLHWFDSRLK